MMEANYLRIVGYNCKVCGKKHKEGDKDGLFGEHYKENFAPPKFTSTEYEDGKQAGIREVVETTVYLALANGDVSIREIFELHPEGQAKLKEWGIE